MTKYITDNKTADSREQEKQRRITNMQQASNDSLPYLQNFCEMHDIKLEVVEGQELDFYGVDYIITIKDHEPLNCSFRLIRSSSKKFFIRYCGQDQGVGEAQKIIAGNNKSTVYITLELPTNTLRFYKMSDIKAWLETPGRYLNTGTDGSRYYTIHFSDLKPIKEEIIVLSK